MWRFWWQSTSLELCCYTLDWGPDLAVTVWALGAHCFCDVLIVWNCLGESQPGTFCLLEHCLHLIIIIISLHCSDQPLGCCWDSCVCLFLFLSRSLFFVFISVLHLLWQSVTLLFFSFPLQTKPTKRLRSASYQRWNKREWYVAKSSSML